MSTRLSKGGRLIDRARPAHFTFNGKRMSGFAGDTLAASLLANDQMLVGRSFKYHRPRGIVASGAEEPNAIVNMGEGGRFEPNQRTTMTELFDGLTCTSQNHFPSLEFDVGVVNNYAARFLPAGFYYKTFIHPRFAWKHVFEPIIRRSAGLGKAPVRVNRWQRSSLRMSGVRQAGRAARSRPLQCTVGAKRSKRSAWRASWVRSPNDRPPKGGRFFLADRGLESLRIDVRTVGYLDRSRGVAPILGDCRGVSCGDSA